MNFTVKNGVTKEIYGQFKTLKQARDYCSQNLLKLSDDRTTHLSNLAAGIINVYEAANTNYIGPGL
jgi:hypothetical protein